ncbi:hypothetical protein PMAYCL1PPCAC_29048 [Pristionchus mayeri]|uniref:TIL domain-containing protein n=1 Tax=Pristionchus mayeri TaxID=1317129 RepID=A0AAN5D972_9BILA|nr:hypothetical protein PMAYCL1PPCAC_29048 [Pristionchus mayeri]
MTSLLFLPFLIVVVSSASMEWCEYWTLLDQKESHPECALFTNSKETILRRIGRYPDEIPSAAVPSSPITPYEPILSASPPKCENEKEIMDCIECESHCTNTNPPCTRDLSCSRGCVCAGGFVRSMGGECIPIQNCPILPTEKEAKVYIDNVKRYMPVIVNDIWKFIFGVEQPKNSIVNTPKILSAIFADHF